MSAAADWVNSTWRSRRALTCAARPRACADHAGGPFAGRAQERWTDSPSLAAEQRELAWAAPLGPARRSAAWEPHHELQSPAPRAVAGSVPAAEWALDIAADTA